MLFRKSKGMCVLSVIKRSVLGISYHSLRVPPDATFTRPCRLGMKSDSSLSRRVLGLDFTTCPSQSSRTCDLEQRKIIIDTF